MPRKTVLIASPEAPVRLSVTESLLRAGYGVYQAAHGMEVIETASLDLPSLIVVDVGSEGLDGWAVVKLLSDSPRTEDLPVVLVMAQATDGERRKAQLLGCRGIVERGDLEGGLSMVEGVIGLPGDEEVTRPRERPTRTRYRAGPVSAA